MRLKVEDVSVRFGGVRALSNVNLEVGDDVVTGLIGPNGAGKTTLFNVISGLQRTEHGQVTLGDRNITSMSPRRRARLGVARTFQRLEIFGSMTAKENIQVAAELHRSWSGKKTNPKAVADAILSQLRLTPIANLLAGDLPTGLSRLVELGRALATEPKIMLLDEPSSGLSTEETEVMGDQLVELAGSGIGILLVEHDMELVMRVSRQVWVLETGAIIASGSPAAVQADPAVRLAYLGAEAHGAHGDALHPEEAARPLGDGSPNSGAPTSGPTPVVVRSEPPVDDPAASNGAVTGEPAALRLTGIRAAYGTIEVIHGVDLSVEPGTVMALLGPNGAGKSTLLKVASGRLRPTKGTVHFGGQDVTRRSSDRLTRSGLCTVPEGRGVFPNLTVAENLSMWTFAGKVRRSDVEERAFTRFPPLSSRRNQAAGTLSGGEQQMLAMSRALSTNPSLLLLDEISMGLAPLIVVELYDLVVQLATEGIAILVVEQSARTALSVADRASVMAAGRLVLTGTPAEVADSVFEVYLGAGDSGQQASSA
jgi:ABC-type branched-subunit amino acid transport system ATPase component